jgi:hypothetical protein
MEDNSHLVKVFTAILNEKPYASRISKSLFNTLIQSDGRVFQAVEAELDHLEKMPGSSPTRTKKHKRLHGEILGGLRHTHYFTNEHMIENIRLHWQGRPDEVLAMKEELERAKRADLSDADAWELAGQIATKLASAYGDRRSSRKLSGEWIVYATHEDQNYYLDLAVHAELSDEQALFDRLKDDCPEFPFCFVQAL